MATNLPPYLQSAFLRVLPNSGQVPINYFSLSFADPETSPNDGLITYNIVNPQGRFTVNGFEATWFTKAQVTSGGENAMTVKFNAAGLAAGTVLVYDMIVSDGANPAATTPSKFVVAISPFADMPAAPGTWMTNVGGIKYTFGSASEANNLNGTSGNDFFVGGNLANSVNGNGGNDFIFTFGGDDNINGGSGNDVIFAGGGNNNINANEGQNWIIAGDGNDNITAGSGDDRIFAGNGTNRIHANEGNNIVISGNGDDLITAGAGNDRIWAGDGNDTVHANEGNNRVDLGAGNDYLTLGSGHDVVIDGAGNDVVFAGEGKNTFKLGGVSGSLTDGNDQFWTGSNSDRFYLYLHDRFAQAAGWGNDTINGFRLGEGDRLVAFGTAPNFWKDAAQLGTIVGPGAFIDGMRSGDGGDLVLTFARGTNYESSLTLKWFFWQNSWTMDGSTLATAYGGTLTKAAMLDVLLDLNDNPGAIIDGGLSGDFNTVIQKAHEIFDAIFMG